MNELTIKLERRNELLLVAYSASKILKKPLNRIQYQKVIYLTNMLAPIKGIILDYFKFKLWFHGPYSYDIQNELNYLTAQGFLKMDEYNVTHKQSKIVENSKYSLDDNGFEIVGTLLAFEEISEISLWIDSVIKIISIYGIENVVDIVYQEPTFKHLKSLESNGKNRDYFITTEGENKFLELFEMLKTTAEKDFGYRFSSPNEVLLALFDYLFSCIE